MGLPAKSVVPVTFIGVRPHHRSESKLKMVKAEMPRWAFEFPAIAQLVERPTVVIYGAAIGRSLVRIRVAGCFLLN